VKRMKRAAGLFFLLFAVTSGSAIAVTDVEWTDSVQAAEAIDAALVEPSSTGADVSAVGGGQTSLTLTNVAFSASRRNGEVRGRMTMINAAVATFSADVVCIGALVSPSGEGGLVRLVGRLTEPAPGGHVTMFFDVYDSGGPGGGGDLYSGGQTTTPPEEFPCEPLMPVDPIVHGNFAVRSLD
jgi:hypothetical protein